MLPPQLFLDSPGAPSFVMWPKYQYPNILPINVLSFQQLNTLQNHLVNLHPWHNGNPSILLKFSWSSVFSIRCISWHSLHFILFPPNTQLFQFCIYPLHYLASFSCHQLISIISIIILTFLLMFCYFLSFSLLPIQPQVEWFFFWTCYISI